MNYLCIGGAWRRMRVLALAIGIMLVESAAVAGELDDLPATVTRIKPAIVGVGTFQPTRQPEISLMGTGFVVADGRHALTNLHVIPKKLHTKQKESLAIFAGIGDQASVRLAEVVAKDEAHDVVLLKFSDAPLPTMKLGDSDRVQEGKLYGFTGFPIGAILGLYPVTHRGIVSSITPVAIPSGNARHLTSTLVERLKSPFSVFQLDATAYPGNSGSPLYDVETGEVVGIVNKTMVQATKEAALRHPSGISFAIPIRYAKALLAKAGL